MSKEHEELSSSELRELELENQSIKIDEHNQARKSLYFQDEYFDNSPLPVEKVKDLKKASYQYARDFNLLMHQLGKEPRFNMCHKCKEWKLTEYICCGV